MNAHFEYSTFFGSILAWLPQVEEQQPWSLPEALPAMIRERIKSLSSDFVVKNDVAIHKNAMIEQGCVIKGPAIISQNCFVAAFVYLRGGVLLGEGASLGPGSEVKSSIINPNSSLAHFNFVGDSILGSNVNFEAGAVTANHFNERIDKRIVTWLNNEPIQTGKTKFGSLVGDNSKVGANAVLFPGTILSPGSIVGRLELVQPKI